jgi:hypothetical protein
VRSGSRSRASRAAGCTRVAREARARVGPAARGGQRRLGAAGPVTWEPSRAYGWVRTVELVDESGAGADIEVVDGFLDVMPAGVDAVTEQRTSNLVDAYKRSETGLPGNAALYALESLITDRAEPAEALAATLVWSAGLDDAEVHLDERIVDDTWQGRARPPVELLTGRRAPTCCGVGDGAGRRVALLDARRRHRPRARRAARPAAAGRRPAGTQARGRGRRRRRSAARVAARRRRRPPATDGGRRRGRASPVERAVQRHAGRGLRARLRGARRRPARLPARPQRRRPRPGRRSSPREGACLDLPALTALADASGDADLSGWCSSTCP